MKVSLKARTVKDMLKDSMAYLFSCFGVLMLVLILVFVFSKGSKMLSFGFLFGDYNITSTTVSYPEEVKEDGFEDPHLNHVYFSSNWGIGLEDSQDNGNNKIVVVTYLDDNSPFHHLNDVGNNTYYSLSLGSSLSSGLLVNKDALITANAKGGAKKMAESLDKGTILQSLVVSTKGGGIRGSLLSTLAMIGLTLLFALPLGIGASLYLTLLVKNKKVGSLLSGLIDLAGGIPSIIYGLAGAILFIPFFNAVHLTNGGSLLSGSLTMALLLLPTIIKTTSEALKTIPSSYSGASLALGANESQTIFKVILPSALPGILTAVLLAIGKIIGESATLIYAVGTGIKDKVILRESSATLAIHIWSLCAGENPNYDAACGVAIIILLLDLILNLAVKLISYQFNQKFGKK